MTTATGHACLPESGATTRSASPSSFRAANSNADSSCSDAVRQCGGPADPADCGGGALCVGLGPTDRQQMLQSPALPGPAPLRTVIIVAFRCPLLRPSARTGLGQGSVQEKEDRRDAGQVANPWRALRSLRRCTGRLGLCSEEKRVFGSLHAVNTVMISLWVNCLHSDSAPPLRDDRHFRPRPGGRHCRGRQAACPETAGLSPRGLDDGFIAAVPWLCPA